MDVTNGEKSKNIENTRYFQKELNYHIFDIFTSKEPVCANANVFSVLSTI